MGQIKRALLSVFDKAGIVEFATALAAKGVELISTGGTASRLREAGLSVLDISDVTGFPEMMDGRVKTLHPKIHGGLLFRRDLEEHRAQAEAHGIGAIDLVVVNLYPFEQTIAKEGVTPEEAIEQIDIGGPSMLRSAAKNWESVTVVCDPADYSVVLGEIEKNDGGTERDTRLALSAKVFSITSRYDGAISAYLQGLVGDGAPEFRAMHGSLRQSLRYGENPHQKAAFYETPGCIGPSIAQAKQLSGKELSFNNILDLSAALEIIMEFPTQACACVLKHNNPCGAAVADSLLDAFKGAYAGDPLSAFGSIVGLSQNVDADVANEIASPNRFVEAVLAPSFSKEAVEILTTKQKWGRNVRLMEVGDLSVARSEAEVDIKRLVGGFLVQGRDCVSDEWADLKVVTKRQPTDEELAGLKFTQLICKHVKSNAIVFAKDAAVVGVGAGQMSRVDSVEIAVKKAGERSAGAVMASDAFFPFPDGIQAAAKAGITAVIQPGGSVKDKDVIEACDELGIAMVMTGLRHFRH